MLSEDLAAITIYEVEIFRGSKHNFMFLSCIKIVLYYSNVLDYRPLMAFPSSHLSNSKSQMILQSYWQFFFFFYIHHSCPCGEAKLLTPPCNWYIIASLLCHFSSSAPLDPLPVSLDVESTGHNGLALEKHRGVCNYTWL